MEIRTGDLFATPPRSWWARLVCRIIGAKTFHWGMFVVRACDHWIVTESIGKGVSITKFTYPKAYVYRIEGLPDTTFIELIDIIAEYGDVQYDWDVPIKTALWWLFKHYLKLPFPRWHDREVNCQEWVVLLAAELGTPIIPEGDYPMCTNLERSPHLELIGEVNG